MAARGLLDAEATSRRLCRLHSRPTLAPPPSPAGLRVSAGGAAAAREGRSRLAELGRAEGIGAG